MRLIRPANKENIEFYPQASREKDSLEELRLQLKSAYSQIAMLKETNKKLACRVENHEREVESYRQIREQLQFLREQDANVKQQLSNYEDINRRLREELQRTEKERHQLSEQIAYIKKRHNSQVIDETAKIERNIRESPIGQQNANSSRSATTCWQQTMRTSSCVSKRGQHAKENHCMTPKSKMRINLQLIPQNLNQRRRVFL